MRFSRNPDPKMWGGSNFDGAVAVMFESFEGGRLTGTLRGTLTSQNTPANPPVTIEALQLRDVLTQRAYTADGAP